MKSLLQWSVFVGLCLSLLPSQLKAEMRADVRPRLRFAKHYHPPKSFAQSYLRFVPEEVYFFSGRQEDKFNLALDIMEEVMNSESFRRKVLSYVNSRGQRRYQRPYLWRDSSGTLSNEEVYQVIMEGREKMRPGTTGEMNFNSWVKNCRWPMTWFSVWCRKVIGSTSPYNSKWIKLNWKFYSYFETPQMVNNMVHEWIHLLGFLHGSRNLHEEVPYVVGSIAQKVAEEILEERGLIEELRSGPSVAGTN